MEITTDTPDVLLPTNDWVFKRIFGDERNKLLLTDMLGAYIILPKEEFEIILLDTHLKREDKKREDFRHRDTGLTLRSHGQAYILLQSSAYSRANMQRG